MNWVNILGNHYLLSVLCNTDDKQNYSIADGFLNIIFPMYNNVIK